MRTLRTAMRVVGVIALSVLLGACATQLVDRRQDVAERGAEVMPFDLDQTTHRWRSTPEGLEQTVVADDPGDIEQRALIREHLRWEAERFRRGDFEDPAAIHGADMPGLALLRAHDGRIAVAYEPTPDGAVLRFTTGDQQLVDALHAWGAAQMTDHGGHAESG